MQNIIFAKFLNFSFRLLNCVMEPCEFRIPAHDNALSLPSSYHGNALSSITSPSRHKTRLFKIRFYFQYILMDVKIMHFALLCLWNKMCHGKMRSKTLYIQYRIINDCCSANDHCYYHYLQVRCIITSRNLKSCI